MKTSYKIFGFIIALFLFGGANSASAGSRFYMTIERSYAPDERLEFRLDFLDDKTPLVVRVLKPKNLETFLEGQLNLSRSYEEPLSSINPGHYFMKGLNSLDSPLPAFRNALSESFRTDFGGASFNGALRTAPPDELVSVPDEIVQSAPAGFEVVREMYVDLQKGGDMPEGLYESWGWGDEGKYKVRTIDLDPMGDGVYLVQAVQAKNEAQALLQVSSISVQVKQSTNQMVVRAVKRDLSPVNDASVSYRDGRGKWITLPSKTDANGEIFFTNDKDTLDGKLVVRVETADNRKALVDTDFLPASANEAGVFIITDRPIFKPGDSFSFKGIIRTRQDGKLVVPPISGKNTSLQVVNADGSETDLKAVTKMSPFGSFSGTFQLDENQKPGLYRVISEIDSKPYAGEFRVRDYVKPTFYLELIDRDPIIKPGESFKFRFKAKRYAGGIPKGARYEVFVYRKKFEAPQWVNESGGGLEAVHDYTGAVKSLSTSSQPQRLYSSVEFREASHADGFDPENTWATSSVIGEDGTASVEFQMPQVPDKDKDQDWIYSVVVRSIGTDGAQAVLSENIYMTMADAVPALQFEKQLQDTPGKELLLSVRSLFPEGQPAPNGKGYVEMRYESADGKTQPLSKVDFKTDANGEAKISLPGPAQQGRVSATAVLQGLNDKAFRRSARSLPASLVIGGAEGASVLDSNEVQIISDRTILTPGEKTKVLAVLPTKWGANNTGVVWESVVGTKVFDSHGRTVQGRSTWIDVEAKPEYGTGFYKTVTVPVRNGSYAEQTLGFRIVPTDKVFRIKVMPSLEMAEPLKPFIISFEVTDASGKAASMTELSVNVVDKAVYAVQPEFRPGILDFFYPLPRMNLATFYSDELQGYGYADEIKKPNFRFTALKSSTKPQKRAMRDTAGWFPHVVTDANGKASVTVDMPANITEWLVTAVAADKGGRVGEGRGAFRSSSELDLDLRAPSYLREGDSVDGMVHTENLGTTGSDLVMSISTEGGVSLQAGAGSHEGYMDPKASLDTPLKLTASGTTAGILRADLKASHLKTGGAREFDIGLQNASYLQSIPGSSTAPGTFSFAVPEGGTPKSAEVRVVSGLLGAALSAGRELVSYPYGCTEQLAHTALPNLALLDLVETAGIEEKDLSALGLTMSLKKAKENVELAIKKIGQNQKSDGSFGLWPNDKEGTFPISLIALRSLQYASDLKVTGADNPLMRGRAWIYDQLRKGKSQELGSPNLLSSYQLSLLADLKIYSELDDVFMDFLKRVNADVETVSIQDIVTALKILNARKQHYWFMQRLPQQNYPALFSAALIKRLGSLDASEFLRKAWIDFGDLGFGFGAPALTAASMGVLRDAEVLPSQLQTFYGNKILEGFNGGWWNSTFETAEIILNLRSVLAEEAAAYKGKNVSRIIPVVSTKGAPLGELRQFPGGFTGSLSTNESGIRLVGLRADERASAILKVDTPYKTLKGGSSGITVTRKLLRIDGKGSSEILPNSTLHKGDVVVSKVSVSRNDVTPRYGLPSSFVAVNDGIPAFSEGIDEDQEYLADANIVPNDGSYWGKVRETLRYKDRTERILELRPGTSMDVYQVWRVAFSGSVSLPPASAVDMYLSDLSGNSEAGSLYAE